MHTNDDLREIELRRAVELYKRMVYGIALHELNSRSRADADDVFQEVFLLYFRKMDELDFPSEEQRRAWLARTAIHICRRVNLSPWNTRVDTKDPADMELVGDIFTDERESAVFSAVRALPEKYRLPVYLHYFENMPVSETAALLGIKESTALMRLHRARKRLKKQLEGEYFE